jgi:hypothetical protein
MHEIVAPCVTALICAADASFCQTDQFMDSFQQIELHQPR